ncbi:MAG TPA: aliphatic sulfonate ABC transporter permease SsuC [Stellaceae bacterium]|nr:aliphatic sulfonate ABC transporter permease SsuC [Stellaceae bacterium]
MAGLAVTPAGLRRAGAAALPWLVPAALVALWQAASSLGWIASKVLPSPGEVGSAFWHLAWTGELWRAIGVSFLRAVGGAAIGGVIGFALGILNGTSPRAASLLDSTLQMLRNIPHLAMIPLVILWFGIGESAKLFLVAVGVFFPIYLNTYHGVRTVDAGLLEMARVYGLDRRRLFFQVVLPGALPSVLVGVRFALGIMWVTLIVAETVSASSGIGYMTMNAREFLETDVVVLGILMYALLGKLADWAAVWVERRCLAWHPAYAVTAAR